MLFLSFFLDFLYLISLKYRQIIKVPPGVDFSD